MDPRIIALYDRFTHGGMTRRAFLDRLAALAGGTAAASALLPLLKNDYALAQTVAEGDPRVASQTVIVDEARRLTGYLARPAAGGRAPAVLVIHENRGLNPHIRDIARRFAAEGFLALALDYLGPLGGTPADEDRAREMIGTLRPDDVLASSRAAIRWLEARPDGNGRAGAVGFCWGGGAVNELAVSDPELDAGVAYYGRQAAAERVPAIRAALLLHYGGLDERINAGIPAYEAALKAAGKTYELHVYEGAHHAFNNDTGPARYSKEAADLAWSRTLAFLRRHLAEG
jgi:carboxymethylenebutenolidase